MKNGTLFYNFVKQLDPKEEGKINKLKSMKDLFHNPFTHIKSESLLNNYSSPKKLNLLDNEYPVLLNQKKKELQKIPNIIYESNYIFNYNHKLNEIKKLSKIDNIKNQDSSESSFNYNYKVGLNAPLSYNDISYNNSRIESDYKKKINIKKNNIENNSYNLLNEIKRNKNNESKENKKYDYKVFLNIDYGKKLDNNKINKNIPNKSNSINNKRIINKKLKNNYSEIHSNRTNNEIIKNNIYNNNSGKKRTKKNKRNNIKIKIINKNSPNKKENYSVFEQILMDLNYVKTAMNKNNKHIIYNISNSKNIFKINNNQKHTNTIFKSQNRNNNILKVNDSKSSSNSISIDLNDINSSRMSNNNIQINTTFNLAQNCIDKKNKLLKNYNNKLSQKENKNVDKDNNKILVIDNNEYSKSNSNKSFSLSKVNQNNSENSEKELFNIKKNINSKTPQNINNKNYLEQIFESRKILTKNKISNYEIPGIKLYKREQKYKENKKIKMENLRRKIKEKEYSEIQNTPIINDKSKKITKNNLPIYERLKFIERKKQSDIKKIKDLIIKENEINETTINNKCNKIFNKNNFDKWLLSNKKWNKQKNDKIEKIKDILNKQKLSDENFNFIPTINKNSERLFKNNEKLSKSPVIDRLFKINNRDLFIQKEEAKKNLSFIPEINKDYQIKDQYYNFMEEDQAEIFNELKEEVEKSEKKLNFLKI